MQYIQLAGIERESETDLQSILANRPKIIRAYEAAIASCLKHGTTLPKSLVTKGTQMLSKDDDARALMTFLRACAKIEDSAIRCRKRGALTKKGQYTTRCLYRLLV